MPFRSSARFPRAEKLPPPDEIRPIPNVKIRGMNVAIEPLPGREERVQFGVGCRHTVRRIDQGEWSGKGRGFDPIELLLASNRGRLRHLLPIKMARMAASPFGFFRGSLPLMVADIARLPVIGIHVQICGDAHLCNLGAYAAPDGHLVFDINDFDESTLGPWEWDVKRFAVSVMLAGRQAKNSERACKLAVHAFMRSYRDTLFALSKLTLLDLFRFQVRRHMNTAPILSVLRKAERSTPLLNLQKLTHPTADGGRQFIDRGRLLQRLLGSRQRKVLGALREYRDTLSAERQFFFDQYKPADVCFKVVGTGSVGVRDYVVLFRGNGPEDALFLQIKEELPSAWAKQSRHRNGSAPATLHQGRRVVDGQRRMQAQSDPFLGWTTLEGREYLVRQLADHKAGIEAQDMKGRHLTDYVVVCGEVLAKGHARSGDACALSGYCGRSEKLDKAIAKFAVSYADQTMADHEAFLAAIKKGKIKCDFEAVK